MVKKIMAALIILSFLSHGAETAGLQGQRPYAPPSEKQFRELKEVLPGLSDSDIEKSIKITKSPENIELINNILVFLHYKKLIKQIKKLPPIFLIYSDNKNVLVFKGGIYYDNKNIIILNANMLAKNIENGKMPANMRKTIDFVTFSTILSHELMHYEDYLEVSEYYNMDAFVLSEWKAYKRSEKSIDYFLKMNKAEADEIIPIPDFYNYTQMLEDYFTDMRKNYIKIVTAADIFLNNENKICGTFGISKDMFKIIAFFPQLQFNVKNGGHIIKAESNLMNFSQMLKFNINILTGQLDILNTPAEIEAIKNQAKNIKLINKKSYFILR
ncbi:MAG: hypothetical protein FWH43_02235 [Endomicrobia bacterium]|nr:hypothetical protein [Endomicrobiia bacterium]